MSHTRKLVRSLATVTAGLALAAPFAASPAQADPIIPMEWDVEATTTIKKLNKEVHLSPGTLSAELDLATGQLTGHLDIPQTTTRLDIGSLPLADVTIEMHETAPVTGTLNYTTGFADTTARFNVQIKAIRPTFLPFVNLVSGSCTTVTPASAHMAGNINLGGVTNFNTTYTLPKFANCGLLTTSVINLAMSGEGNGLNVDLHEPS